MDADNLIGAVPWLTKDGCLDPGKFPIDGVLKQSLAIGTDEFRSGLNMLRSMYAHGRKEAGLFLLGLLLTSDEDLERRGRIVEALQGVDTKPCADLLFGELKRVKSSNTTRRYLATVIRVLASRPSEMIEEGFTALAADKSFSQKMRAKFRAIVAGDEHPVGGWF